MPDLANDDLLPVRMLAEYAYCPRLFHLEHVEGHWADNEFTEDGRWVHRRLDTAIDGVLDPPDAEDGAAETSIASNSDDDSPPEVTKSVKLGSHRLGIIAKLDMVVTDGETAVPVDTKRSEVPRNEDRSYEPERVQLMAQALLLREHGYRCEKGVLYYAGSKTRVDVPFTAELEARTCRLIEQARTARTRKNLPLPLDSSPKCAGCSLSGICLPDEVNALLAVPEDPAARKVRRLYPARDVRLPVYVQEQGATVGKSGETLIVRKSGEIIGRVKIKDIDQLVLCGNINVTAQAVHLLCHASLPIVHLSMGHWFYGVTHGITLKNAYDRAAQFNFAADAGRCLALSRSLVEAKCRNQRTLLRRNGREAAASEVLELKRVIGGIHGTSSLQELLGVEGIAAAHYFRGFPAMLRPSGNTVEFDINQRNRRPPRDPINALLSFGYAILVKECTVALLSAGLDPYWGVYHQPRHGRPALSLDLMEEFRPLIVDSAVITAVNTGSVRPSDFVIAASGCSMKTAGRKRFIKILASRMEQLVTHPLFGYRCTWRQIIKMQARLLARHFRGELPEYRGMTTR